MAVQSRSNSFRLKLDPAHPVIAMASHNPLSAKLAAEAGFDAIWVSGFEISASHAVPDSSILPMSVSLEVTRGMSNVQDLPLIVDMDTGYGNAVNVAYSLPQFEKAGASAVVIEDKQFPKNTSLQENARHALVSIAEFQGKIQAARSVSSLTIIARTEALIAGLGQEEALKRAMAYAEAGADAILVHSKQKTPDEIIAFCQAWPGTVPLVIVPTNYPQLSFSQVAALGKVGMIICGNHAIRSAVASMRLTFKRIIQEGNISCVEDDISTVTDILDLQDTSYLKAIEKDFLHS